MSIMIKNIFNLVQSVSSQRIINLVGVDQEDRLVAILYYQKRLVVII